MRVVMPDWSTTTARSAQRFFTTLACGRCGGPILVEHTGPGTVPGIVKAYPEGQEGTLVVRNLPEDVEHYYRDAITVLQAGVPEATAVQLRRTLEAAAAHFDVKPFPLVAAVKELAKKGLITAQFVDVLGHIRQVGNIGAHASDKRIDMPAAQRALRFTTQVLRNLFEIPAELRELGVAPEEPSAEAPD